MADRTLVGKVKGLDPEQFVFIALAADLSGVKRVSGPMSETELRAVLSQRGMQAGEITSYIEHARKHPV